MKFNTCFKLIEINLSKTFKMLMNLLLLSTLCIKSFFLIKFINISTSIVSDKFLNGWKESRGYKVTVVLELKVLDVKSGFGEDS